MISVNDVVSNVKVYGLDQSVTASKYPFATDIDKCNSEITKTVLALAQAPHGSGEDTFMHGIVVQFNLTFTVKAWVQAERYHFLEFVSSQSEMHKLMDFDVKQQCIEYVDSVIINREIELIQDYLANPTTEKKLIALYSCPQGFRLTARMTTDYTQLKTIYAQRRKHILPEWRVLCDWMKSLPHSEFITGKEE